MGAARRLRTTPGGSPPRLAPEEGDLLARFLDEHDVACPQCGYGLRGVPTGRCPECAAELSLTLAARKNGTTRVAAEPTRIEVVTRTAVRASRRALAASRDAFAEHHARSATLDAFAQIGLGVGIALHGIVGIVCIAAPRPATIALGVVMLLVVAVCAVLLRISFDAGAWAASQSAAVRCAYALAGWWWSGVWVLLMLVSLL